MSRGNFGGEETAKERDEGMSWTDLQTKCKSKLKDQKSVSQRKDDRAVAPRRFYFGSAVLLPTNYDPDAIQLFRRYNQSRSGVLTKLAFFQLLKDYAESFSSTKVLHKSVPLLSIMSCNSIPFGSDRNLEFEAGQLFEQYDKDHSGALTLEMFHDFFLDFKPDLQVLVEDSAFRALALPATTTLAPVIEPGLDKEFLSAPAVFQDIKCSEKALFIPKVNKARYQAALRKLRELCQQELFNQRKVLVERMKGMREEMTHLQQCKSSRLAKGRSQKSPLLNLSVAHSDIASKNKASQLYEAMDDDLIRMDELIKYVRNYLNKVNVSQQEMRKFLEQADGIEEEAKRLAMKDYEDVLTHVFKEKDRPLDATPSIASIQLESLLLLQRQDFESLLRVKDHMIYQLLQERLTMRRERAAIKDSLRSLSDVSTEQMKKWARLTNDMQSEIQQLQTQLRFHTCN
ncbi:hypothetical protein CCR75_006475 [Bremia lactucae]|uniref:EF-hand domain-containing protein n=1 Tax=Bremia lactucae TaxID=4779 RepID=A0A976IC06_BRELC|nr:hypothetical protein CCR75_006475 [Bremia lactucae]